MFLLADWCVHERDVEKAGRSQSRTFENMRVNTSVYNSFSVSRERNDAFIFFFPQQVEVLKK